MTSIKMNLTNSNGIPPMKEPSSLMEDFFRVGEISDYTSDGWVLVNRNWIPFSHFMKQKEQNEHSGTCR